MKKACLLLTRYAKKRQRAPASLCSRSLRGIPFLNTKDSERRSIWQSRSKRFVSYLRSGLIVGCGNMKKVLWLLSTREGPVNLRSAKAGERIANWAVQKQVSEQRTGRKGRFCSGNEFCNWLHRLFITRHCKTIIVRPCGSIRSLRC